jgi:hypothetical protein
MENCGVPESAAPNPKLTVPPGGTVLFPDTMMMLPDWVMRPLTDDHDGRAAVGRVQGDPWRRGRTRHDIFYPQWTVFDRARGQPSA